MKKAKTYRWSPDWLPRRDIRVGEEDWQTLKKAAEVSGRTVSALIREAALAEAQRVLAAAPAKEERRPLLAAHSSRSSRRCLEDALVFDHEKLDVYQLQLAFIAWVSPLLDDVGRQGTKSKTREVRDQLNRASLSALLNLAEGNGKRQRATRAKFFDDSRGSATECAACLDALVAQGVCTHDQIHSGKELLVRIVSMLTKLIVRFEERTPDSPTREVRNPQHRDAQSPSIEDEDDDEDEDDRRGQLS